LPDCSCSLKAAWQEPENHFSQLWCQQISVRI